ncbi:hypothetical protein M2475_001366 [Breznakia sp. PF5-3]|uniref:hypothetical protein n=1 Tax=unclassified Breznakia TaxID=2623764 RepID=UPI002406A381|nr:MULTISPECIES: hypothetical protein [unclassified Breznakia]MDF9824940.1 hypothetical protein [Breznakia sp. PM6-1]MDF9835792.1 hypothetical protein [Breznakia sp. PF5-3]MDF9837914.1 hypothetical protein [Breznakia sp. PFB2-8]MDF9859903.1 hypothetical protein [Breznakia sp. PH5-24]
MKKRMVLIVLLGLLVVGCTSNNTTTEKEKDTDVIKTVDENTEESQENEEVISGMTQDEFIISTFASYGYTTPDKSDWIIKEEGNDKVAIIIKVHEGKGKPNISKLIFLWNGSSEEATVLFVMVNNQPMYEK